MGSFQTQIRQTNFFGRFAETQYYENLNQTQLILLAPHGGQVEPNTEQIIQLINQKVALPTGLWYTTGIVNGSLNKAFKKWHTTNKTHSVTDFSLYNTFLESTYDLAISFHVMSKEGIIIGGRSDNSVKQSLQTHLQNVYNSQQVIFGTPQSTLSGLNPTNFVNTIPSTQSIHIELSRRISMENPWKIAEAVTNWLEKESTEPIISSKGL